MPDSRHRDREEPDPRALAHLPGPDDVAAAATGVVAARGLELFAQGGDLDGHFHQGALDALAPFAGADFGVSATAGGCGGGAAGVRVVVGVGGFSSRGGELGGGGDGGGVVVADGLECL